MTGITTFTFFSCHFSHRGKPLVKSLQTDSWSGEEIMRPVAIKARALEQLGLLLSFQAWLMRQGHWYGQQSQQQ
jgi:hypothetical protein